jgi:hypothetical protein
MAESNAPSRVSGWLKAVGSSIFGLVSGAVLMYLTPLVDHAIKPPDPVANFGYQAQGLAVSFQNRTANASDGWWDFGDGSALEPFSPQQSAVTHSYAKPGSYIVKLSVHNLFNEKSERDVTVNLDASTATSPTIDSFEVTRISECPAVFHLTAEVKNADQIAWVCGDGQPVEVSRETSGKQERYVTINEPGLHRFRLVAIGSKQSVEKAAPPQSVLKRAAADTPIAMLTVSYNAVHVDRQELPVSVRLPWRHDCRDNTCPSSAEWMLSNKPGYQIVKAELDGSVKDYKTHGQPTVQVAPDGSKVVVSAELMRPAGLIAKVMPQGHAIPLKLTVEKRSPPATKACQPIPVTLKVPGETSIPIPALSNYWQATNRTVTLDLCEGSRKIWSGTDMPVNRPLQLCGHAMVVSAAMRNDRIVLTVTSPVSGVPPTGN